MSAVYTSELERVEAENKLLRNHVKVLERDNRQLAAECERLRDQRESLWNIARQHGAFPGLDMAPPQLTGLGRRLILRGEGLA